MKLWEARLRQWHEMAPEEQTAYAAEALAKRATDKLKYPLSVMAAAVGTTAEVLKQSGDPAYAERRRQKVTRPVRRTRHPIGDGPQEWERGGAAPDEYEARRREIPADNRGLTATILGDPIPGDTRRQRYGNDWNARADRGCYGGGSAGVTRSDPTWWA